MKTYKKKLEKSRNRYSNSLKRKIAKDYLSGRASYSVLAEENGLKNKGVVKEFVKWYRKNQSIMEEIPSKEENTSELSPLGAKEKDSALAKEVAELHKQLQLSELKIEGLETMIDKAEEELNISIRKKSGTKPSKK